MTRLVGRNATRWTRLLTRLVAACLVVAAGVVVPAVLPGAPGVPRAAAGVAPHLLLIHGFQDNCSAAFHSNGGSGQAHDTDTTSFLTSPAGGGWQYSDITTVGYYYWDDYCDFNLNGAANTATVHSDDCKIWDPRPGYWGTTDELLFHVACEFAWYIYDTYTLSGIPVQIVAHSMGGLITRAAIGGAGYLNKYPPQKLLVTRVVTVATPHGGVSGVEQTSGYFTGSGQQLSDMDPSSTFMDNLKYPQFQRPQGSTGTFWALIGSSVPAGPLANSDGTVQSPNCVTVPSSSWGLARVLSDLVHCLDNNSLPDGDGVVQALSQVGMQADYKVLYGEVEDMSANHLYVADKTTAYQHEGVGTCEDIPAVGHTCTHAPFYLNDGSLAQDTSAFVCSSGCTATGSFSDVHLSQPRHYVRHSLAELAWLLRPIRPSWVVGHAANAGDDYPYETLGQFSHTSEGTDGWNEFYGQCDSFAAWKAYENTAAQGTGIQHPTGSVPAAGWKPSNAAVIPVDQFAWAPPPGPSGGKYGNADVWGNRMAALDFAVDNIPTPGAIAWWPNAVSDPQDGNPPDPTHGLSSLGHVAYVTDVYPDGSITMEQYNVEGTGEYSTAHLAYNTGYTDTAFGRTSSIPWPGGFIHIADGPSGAASPLEPAVGTVWSGYPGQASNGLIVLGPGDSAGGPTLAGSAYPGTVHGWYTEAGHGEIGQMLWTNTHKGAADSTATYNAHLAGLTCYRIDAFVPDRWSNNSGALYLVTDQHFGTSMVAVDENKATNQWVQLGVFQARSDGTLPVTLRDQGSGTGQVAADAMRFIRQPGCTGTVRAAQTLTPTLAGQPYPNTVNGWYLDSGRGQLGSSRYTYTNGMTVGSTATWSASVLPNACYEILAYVPDGHSNSYQAMYTISSAASGHPVVSVDENAFTNNWASLGNYRADSSGYLAATLTDQSLKGADAFVAADTMSFAQIACPSVLEGTVYPTLTAGPGSPLSAFSLSNDWFNQFGHGQLGYAKWTHTNGSSPQSIATWTFSSLPTFTCYQVYAYIPDAYANNTAAHYQGYMGQATTGTFMFSSLLNQANWTGWAPLGVVGTGSGSTVAVTLDDTGPAGTYTSADAVQLGQLNGSCGTSGALNPSAYPWPSVAPTTYIDDGHGYYEGECVSFAAWAIRTDGMPHTKSPDHLGNANQWTGAYIDSGPHVGDIAQWDPNVGGAGSLGHVAYVAAVNGDGTIKVYEYNFLDSYNNNTGHRLSIRTVATSSASRYLHF